jgi:DUF438 domain-containing protein
MMKNTIVYLIGYAGTGKYTIAREIAVLTSAVIVDNHLINNPVFSVVGVDGIKPLPAGVWQKIGGIRRIVLETIAELAQPEASFILTNELYEGQSADRRLYEDIATLAAKREALFVPVILRCEAEELYRRVTSPERAIRFKLRNADWTRESIRIHNLLHVDHPNGLELDVTNLSPIEVAQKIITHVEKRSL